MTRTIALIAAALFAGTASAEDYTAKIVGTWELTKTERLDSGGSFTIKFSKDGTATSQEGTPKMKFSVPHTWKIDGDKLTIISKEEFGFKFETGTITSITAKKMTVKLKSGFEEEFTRLMK